MIYCFLSANLNLKSVRFPDELFAGLADIWLGRLSYRAEVMPEQNITAENPDEDESPEKDVAVERFEDSPERVIRLSRLASSAHCMGRQTTYH